LMNLVLFLFGIDLVINPSIHTVHPCPKPKQLS
jgi:hypothetical protein